MKLFKPPRVTQTVYSDTKFCNRERFLFDEAVVISKVLGKRKYTSFYYSEIPYTGTYHSGVTTSD